MTFDVVSAVNELKSGRAEFRVDKAGIVHAPVGKVSMDPGHLTANAQAVVDALLKAKPATAKGVYMKKMAVSATMGPGVKVDTSEFR